MSFLTKKVYQKLLLSFVIGSASATAFSAPGTLSNVPLFLGTSVPPNILFVLDDSGSMDWEVLKTNEAEAIWPDSLGGFSPRTNIDITPTDTDPDELLESCIGYNVMYYNPETIYTPWVGLNESGVAYADQSITSAIRDPYYSTSSGSINLLLSDGGGDPPGYIPWDDLDGDKVFDEGECGDTVIRDGDGDVTGATVDYSRFVSVPSMSAEQQANFANWYSYYRKREYVMKRAISEIITNGDSRMGLATLHNNNDVGIEVKDIDDITAPIDPDSDAVENKKLLLDRLFQVDSDGLTPLRTRLEDAGQYFERGNTAGAGTLFGYSPEDESPILSEAEGGACQQNFTVLLSDGVWNGGTDPSIENADGDNTTEWDGDSYADEYEHTLADVAMHFYEINIAPDLEDGLVPVSESVDNNKDPHMVTFTVSFGVNGTLSSNPVDKDEAFSWPRPFRESLTTIDDMRHAAWNGRGEYLSAANPEELIESLNASISSIQDRTSSASAVAFNTTSVTAETLVYQARFDSQSWNGTLRAFQFTEEGTTGDAVWDAGELLDSTSFDVSSRNIYTYRTDTEKGIPFAFPSNYQSRVSGGSAPDDDKLNQEQIRDLLVNAPYDASTGTAEEVSDNQLYGEAIVDYLSGSYALDGLFLTRADTDNPLLSVNLGEQFRDRSEHRLGDIVHSSPEFVGEPNERYPNNIEDPGAPYFGFIRDIRELNANTGRTDMVYVGANDGMLHAFEAQTGIERFTYIPGSLFSDDSVSGMHKLAEADYGHVPYVDGSPSSRDVYINGKWRTVLVGGFRAGGKAVYVLDVTNPADYFEGSSSSAENLVLTEFTDDNLGFTFSKPQIARLNNGKWGAIFGNGYNSDPTGDGTAKIFILYLDGSGHKILETRVGSVENSSCSDTESDCNGMSSPSLIDTNGDFRLDRIYAGDLKGNLWVFDVSDSSDSNWGSAYGTSFSPDPLFSTGGQPITSKPVIAGHPIIESEETKPNAIVMFGTGQYVAENDNFDQSLQSFYGIWDTGEERGNISRDDLIEQDILDGGSIAEDARLLTDRTVNYSISSSDGVYGWYIDLVEESGILDGERVVVDPIVSGSFVFFNTTIPDDSVCSPGGSGFLMVAKLINGGQPGDQIFLNDQNGEPIDGSIAGLGLKAIPGGSVIIDNQIVISDSSGDISEFQINPDGNSRSRRASWSIVK